MPATADDFRAALQDLAATAKKAERSSITVSAGELHRIVGGYPGKDHRMPICCRVMRERIRESDKIIAEPPSGQGASLAIVYRLAV